MQVATICYFLVPLQLPIRALHMDRKLGKNTGAF